MRENTEALCVCVPLQLFLSVELWVAGLGGWEAMFSPVHAQDWTESPKLLKRTPVAGESYT